MDLKVLGSSSKGNCYLLQNQNETLIIECGIKYKEILKGLNFNLNNIVGCLVTHEHMDHSKAIKDLIKNGIDVYSSVGTIETLDLCGVINNHRLDFIESEKQIKVGNFTILPFATKHDAAEPLGFLIQHIEFGKLLFITDSYYCQYSFKGLEHIMIECNYSMDILQQNIEDGLNKSMARRLLKSHFSLENVKKFLQVTDLTQVKDIILLHLSDGNSNSEQFKTEIQRLTGIPTYIADVGLEISL